MNISLSSNNTAIINTYWHSIGIAILIISAVLRLAALLFIAKDIGYLRCTRGLGSNVMALIHVSLLIAELITAVVLTFFRTTLSYYFWMIVVFDYVLLFFCMVCTGCKGTRKVGCLHAFSAFEFVNLIIFWAIVAFMGMFLPYFSFWILVFCAIPYAVLICGAERNYKRFKFYRNSMSKFEATEKIKRILEDKPSIAWQWIQSVENGAMNDFIRHSVVLSISIALETSAWWLHLLTLDQLTDQRLRI